MKAKNEKSNSVLITAILVIGALEVFALSQGMNGILLTTVIALLAGLAGWRAPQLKLK